MSIAVGEVEPLSEVQTGRDTQLARLEWMGLPRDYAECTRTGQREARLACLRGWFDTKRPQVLCTDVEAYLKAHHLFVEYYLKRDPGTRVDYSGRDAYHKDAMLRAVLAPAKAHGQPACSVIIAPRGSQKSITLRQMVCMVAAFRPYTRILESQYNTQRTGEEMEEFQHIFERCDLLRQDMGFPEKLPSPWGTSAMLIPGTLSMIRGVSINAAGRGRRTHLALVDDPDDGKIGKIPNKRAMFYSNLFRIWFRLPFPGTPLAIVQTNTGPGCMLEPAFACLDHDEKDTEEFYEGTADERFRSWNIVRFKAFRLDGDGHYRSISPDTIPDDSWEEGIQSTGLSAAMAELQGVTVNEGSLAFSRKRNRHGFMHCEDNTGEYFLDLKTGERRPWEKFVKSLYTVGAADPAFSKRADSCPRAAVVLGLAPNGCLYVLDVYNRRSFPDVFARFCVDELIPTWKLGELGVEINGPAGFLYIHFRQLLEQRAARGESGTLLREIDNSNRHKIERIITTIRPMLVSDRVRFLSLNPVRMADGVVHQSAAHPRHRNYIELLEQIDEFTDSGGPSDVDALDALEMAIRMVSRRMPPVVTADGKSPKELAEEWERLGFNIDRHSVSREHWTPQMVALAEAEVSDLRGRMGLRDDVLEMDPYAS